MITQRTMLVESARILAVYQLLEAYGHVSVSQSHDEYLLTPRVGPGLATPESLLCMDASTNEVLSGAARVPIEASIHSAIYRARPDVHAIARIHSLSATALSVCGRSLFPVHYLGSILGPEIRVHDVADLVLTGDAGADVANFLSTDAALMLRGNGQVVVGSSIKEATARAYYLDESARIHVAAASLGNARPLSDEEVERSKEIWADEVNVDRVWNYHRHWALSGLNRRSVLYERYAKARSRKFRFGL